MSANKGIWKLLNADAVMEHLAGYIETRVELLKLEVKEETVKIAAKLLSFLVVGFLVLMIVIFLSFTIAWLLNHYFESEFLGFAIVTGFYTLILVIALIFKSKFGLQRLLEQAFKQKTEGGLNKPKS